MWVDDDHFQDAEEQLSFSNEKLNFRFIVLEYLRKIGDLCAVEFRGGYDTINPKTNKEIHHPDTRSEFINAVNYLLDLLQPKFMGKYAKYAKIMQQLTEEEHNLFNRYHIYKAYTTDLKVPILIHDDLKEKYQDEKVIIKRKVFQAICIYLNEDNYLEIADIRDK